ncbi:MAG: DUF192 domain-containing protein [Atopobiaceae bacterium]|nr:DUF192 domain-containing protein [Atopobiaceae bacterium]
MCRVIMAADGRPHEPIAFQVLTTWLKRLRGLLGTSEDADPVALMRCRSIHTFAMAYPIDIAFVDEGGWILDAIRALEPNRRASSPDAFITLERPAADTPWFETGERLSICSVMD